MRRQHFAVGVDVDVLSFGLFEQHAQIFQIVAGDQNGFPGYRAHVDRAGPRIAVGTVSPRSRIAITLKFILPMPMALFSRVSTSRGRVPSQP